MDKSRIVGVTAIGAIMIAAAPLTGVWSGDRATLTLTANGGTLVEDCRTTTLDAAPSRDRAGHLVAIGHHDADEFGPMRTEPAAAPVAVRISFRHVGDTLEVTTTPAGGTAATVRLRPGATVKRIRCL